MPVETARFLLAAVLLPMWIGAGVLDWACHRRAQLERNAGPRESLLHLLMFAEVGVPLLAVLFLEIDAGVFAVMALGFVLHEATALWDVAYAVRHREVSPFEQHVHSFLEMLPLMGIALLVVLHPGQAMALIGQGPETAHFDFTPKREPLPAGYVGGVLIAVVLLGVLPYIEELVRGVLVWARASPATKPPQRTASASPTAR